MLRPRIIPCLLIHNGGLVKTVKFGDPKYVGDPLNAVRIFNEKEVDELMVVDIDASRNGVAPDEKLIAQMAAECRMPLCYGGGVKSADVVERLVALGVEKVALSSAAVEQPSLISEAAERVGRQSVVVVMDVKATGLLRSREVVTYNATRRTGYAPVDFALKMQEMGAGEIVLNSVDRDGVMQGYDLALVDQLKAAIDVPLTVIGGAGKLDDIRELVERHPVIGAAAGSLFVFKGKFRAVLINYPDRAQRDLLAREL
ncbi:MAG: imidazole glycerol phosphate synthase subunit HisF [Sphingopyxis sp.]|jgi:cyclase|uniref:AglZ/HisF2 family acetamidino modification protein n=1 Tax=Sphingopyxis sp. TaxID=1908224 RepID=UPI001A62AB2B|nr:AglZ/HisF2 family acetamidino modification protein [Sphingopyxis sp.]MBL9071699.1 imidazole glycerol phosphate synthase subunit HisF [Sphingopyxis sp.]